MHIVYKTTCLVNGKIYIGAHTTDDLNDGYIGSGKAFLRAVKQHGRDAFSREVLAVFDNPETMYAYEAELVTEEFVKSRDNYNLQTGGDCGVKKSDESKQLMRAKKIGRKWSEEHRINASLAKKGKPISEATRLARIGRKRPDVTNAERVGDKNPFYGRKHSEETKEKMRLARANRNK